MDLTQQFHKVAFQCFKEENKDKNENEVKEMFEEDLLRRGECTGKFNEAIKNIEQEIDNKIQMANKSCYDILTGNIDINDFLKQESFGDQLTVWTKKINEEITYEFMNYKQNNKNKIFSIKHYSIVTDQLKDKVLKLQKKNNNQIKMIWNVLNMNSELLFQLHPELLSNKKNNQQNENESETKEDEGNIQKDEKSPKSLKEEIPIKLNESIFDDFDSDDETETKEKQTEKADLIIKKNEKVVEKKSDSTPVRISQIKTEKVKDVDFDGAWENEEEERDEIDEEEERLLKQTQNRMDDVYKVIIEKIENINELNTKIGEMAVIQLESTQHIVDAVEEAQVYLVAGNKALEEAHDSMKSWWTPKKIAAIIFYIAALMLLVSHLTSK